jgi:hypothetical protein
MKSKCRWLIISICFITGMLSAAKASDVCTVTGEVLDKQTMKKLANVNVIMVQMQGGLPYGTRTDANGNYTITMVFPPGQYKITYRLDGYNSVEKSDVRLEINTTRVVMPPVIMEPATGPSTTLTMGGKVAEVNIADAAQKLTMDRQAVATLPLSGIRTFDALAFLSPAVAPVPQSAGTGPGVGPGVGTAGQFSVNGQRGRQNNFLVDMSDNNDQDVGVRRQGYVSLVPQSIESIEQFQVITGTYQAEFGRNSGSIVNAISKTGGNSIHGSAYGYFNNSSLSARNPFDQVDGPAPGESSYSRSQYGFAVGGPFVRDRTFWFGSFERQQVKDRPERHFAVPLMNERTYFGYSPSKPSTIPGVSELEKYFRDAGYYMSGVAGTAIWGLFPAPNNPGGPYGANTYTEQMYGDGAGTIFSLKADHRFSNAHSLTGRYNFTDDALTLPVTGGGIRSSIRPETRTQNLSLFLNSVFSSSIANQLRVSYGRTNLAFQEVAASPLLFGSTNTAELQALFAGNASVQKTLTTPIQTDFGRGTYGPFGSTGALGQLIVRPYSPLGVDVNNFPQARVNNTYQYADTLAFTRGVHLLKFGVDIRQNGQNSRLDRNFRTLAEFNSGQTVDLDNKLKIVRGRDLASIGYATAMFQTMIPDFNGDGKPDFNSRINLNFREYGFFIQDDWKALPRLTLNFGLRYEYSNTPESVGRLLESTFANPLAGVPAQTYPPGNEADKKSYEAMVAAYTAAVGGRELMYESDKKNWAPRIGLAWDVTGDGKTAVRAGYGIFYDQNISAVTSQSRNVFSHLIPLNSSGFGIPLTGTYLLTRQWLYLMGSPHQQYGTVNTIGVPPQYFGLFLGTQASQGNQGLAFTLPTPTLKTPRAQQFHFALEREIIPDTMASIAYFGSIGSHLTRFRMPNGGIVGQTRLGLYGPSTAGDILSAQTQAPVSRMQTGLGPYSIFENSAPSNYHSLQLAALRRFSRGLEFTAAYSWSHSIDEVSDVFANIGFSAMPQSDNNLGAERASSNFDIRHRFVGSFVWDLPLAKDQAVLGGWRLSGIFTAQTGQPYTVNSSMDVNNDGVLTDRLNTVAGFNQEQSGPILLVAPAGTALLAPWGQNGAVGRNSFRAPGVATFDMALLKLFRFAEQRNVEFRTEIFNLFNRTHYGIPVSVLEAPGFGRAVNTSVDTRRIQFAVKLNF